MAIGKKTGGRNFKPGQSGNPSGQPKLPEAVVAARKFNQVELETMLTRCMYLPLPEIKKLASNTNTTSPIMEMIVAKILHKAFEHGDHWKAEFILQRVLGRVRDPLPPDPVTPQTLDVTPTKRTYTEFCIKAGYPAPFIPQIKMFDFWVSGTAARMLLGARGYGKTDYCTVLGIAYDLYLNPGRRHLIISKSKTRNSAMLEEIANALEMNGVELEKQNSTCIRLKGLHGKDHSVEALPLKASFRGRHPDQITMDDPVTEEDTSEAMRILVKKKYDEAYKLCKNIVIIGQPAHKFDLYAKLRPLLELMEVPHGTIPELDADLNAMELAGIDKHSIEMSYHLRVPKSGASIFSEINFIDEMPTGPKVAFIDPSDGGDFTAVSIFRAIFDGMAVEGKALQRAWYHCIDDWTPWLVEQGVKHVWFETNATGKQPIEQLRKLWAPHGIVVVGVHSDTNKHAGIQAAGSYAHLIHLSKKSDKVYSDQVTEYEAKSKYDDAPDSLARGLMKMNLIKGKK